MAAYLEAFARVDIDALAVADRDELEGSQSLDLDDLVSEQPLLHNVEKGTHEIVGILFASMARLNQEVGNILQE